MEWPALAELAPNAFPQDVIARAKELQEEIGSVGAYSHSMGVPFIRKNVAKFIEGTCSSLRSIFLDVLSYMQNGTGTLRAQTTFSLPLEPRQESPY